MNKKKLKCLQPKLFWVRNSNKMSEITIVNFIFDCYKCDYTCTTKTKRNWDMMVRLHKKKCKATGRTLTTKCEQSDKKRDIMNSKSVSNALKSFKTETLDVSEIVKE
jgi:hypothetical protein